MPRNGIDGLLIPRKHLDGICYLFGDFCDRLALVDLSEAQLLRLDRFRRHILLTVLDYAVDLSRPVSNQLLYERFSADTGLPVASAAPVYRKLSAAPLRVGQYKQLSTEIGRSPKAARMITHSRDLLPTDIEVFFALPASLRRPKFLSIIHTPERASAVRHLYDVAVKHGRAPKELTAALLSVEDLAGVQRILSIAITPKELAPGPVPTDPRLVSMTSLEEIRALGRAFQNCLPNFAGAMARAADTHIYKWSGDEECIVSVIRDGAYGLRIGEIAGVRNESVSPETEAAILMAFSDRALVRRPSVWELLNDL